MGELSLQGMPCTPWERMLSAYLQAAQGCPPHLPHPPSCLCIPRQENQLLGPRPPVIYGGLDVSTCIKPVFRSWKQGQICLSPLPARRALEYVYKQHPPSYCWQEAPP